MQYALLARLTDLLRLKAVDLTVTTLVDTPAISVRFRCSKSDPRYNGNTSYIVYTGMDYNYLNFFLTNILFIFFFLQFLLDFNFTK